ncbi:uncharacterized protein LOC114522699 [Dendronephthya gigantea]|uniref:uncharacterized protein LOC114522699 n=1 Tax=Dendronephthya gigantea TaxID=151771 RepID=UPI00106AC59C|nr:uncharacterized protein LOC114522699 [Dendronephthya gigantea]
MFVALLVISYVRDTWVSNWIIRHFKKIRNLQQTLTHKQENFTAPVTEQKRNWRTQNELETRWKKTETEDLEDNQSDSYSSDSEEEIDYGWDIKTSNEDSLKQLNENIDRNIKSKEYIAAKKALVDQRKQAGNSFDGNQD